LNGCSQEKSRLLSPQSKRGRRRADDAEQGRREAEQQWHSLLAEVADLQRQLAEKPQVIEKPVENLETEAELARLRGKYAEIEARLKQKTERVAELGAELDKHADADEHETYRRQVRSKWRLACDAFHRGVDQGMVSLVTPLDASQAFEGGDWARLVDVENTLSRALLALSRLRESVSRQFVEG
jgi:chromosome segregation ATPase